MRENIAANHKNNKGLLLKCTALQENVNYFRAECQAVTFKYEVMKKRLSEEKKARKSDAITHQNRIAGLNSQIQMLTLGHMQGNKSGAPMAGIYAGQMAAMMPMMQPVQVTTGAVDASDTESVELPSTLANKFRKPSNE